MALVTGEPDHDVCCRTAIERVRLYLLACASAASLTRSGPAFTVRLQMSLWASVAAPIREVTLAGRRVLVVDDNATNRTILQHHLTSGGMHSGAAADGPSALALLACPHARRAHGLSS